MDPAETAALEELATEEPVNAAWAAAAASGSTTAGEGEAGAPAESLALCGRHHRRHPCLLRRWPQPNREHELIESGHLMSGRSCLQFSTSLYAIDVC